MAIERGAEGSSCQARGATPRAEKRASELPRQHFPAVSENELLKEGGRVSHLIRTPFPQFESDVLRDVSAPALGDIEAHHESGVNVLAFQQIADDGLTIGVADIALPPRLAVVTKVIDDEIDVLIDAGND